MSAAALIARTAARRTGRGWVARCPAHDDRGPSLSIAEGADGRTLLKCFAGCDVARIVAALGLEMRDLFARENNDFAKPQRTRREPTPAEIRDELTLEAESFRRRHVIDAGFELLSSEKNAIRHRVAARLGISLAPIPRPIWEGDYGGRERDPAWPLVFERAWEELWIERGMKPPHVLAQRDRELSPRVRWFVEQRAIALLAGRRRDARTA